ncbi:hypothetical protein ATI61_102629 [Archangium gephyra]|uniref:Uncharacterized protein n=1 Tax=Archangium gephyra TaxID=48 RepID=A0AAC8QEB3_9BACT|nr:hypothetical protein [Archangium gephyra]AKJ05571.1 Hypothetical protein AA314_07197 [Archangium gephyra]REG36252.1 hypothetical protein ATI61_102629 [Archangium gephyra]
MAGLWLASTALADPPPLDGSPTDRIGVEAQEDLLALSWSDTEERLKGSIRPATPREGEPLQIDLQVGSFEGEDFEGPLILTLREEGATHGQSLTVKKSAQHWQATFTPENDGPHLLDVSFRTTRHKALHASLQVRQSRLPLRLGWAVLGLGCLALIGYTVRGLLKGERAEERALPPSEGREPVLPVDTPSAPASGTPAAAQSPTPGAEAPPGGEATATPVDAGAQPPDSAPKTSEGEPPA